VDNINKILNIKGLVSFFKKLSNIILKFSLSEKLFFYFLCIVFITSGLVLVEKFNRSLMIDVPANGGYLKEGIIGSPRFVNPVLAVSDVDHDLVELIYSGLVKNSADNSIIPDLAESYEISDDGLEYTFVLRDDIYFHDGEKVTTDDVEFTINTILDSNIKSPKRPSFYDVTVEKIDAKTIIFKLKKPYSPFLQNLTVGILPKHLWNNLTADEFSLSQYNVEAIGSGPYKIKEMKTLQKNMLLIPTYYELEPFNKFALGEPYINKLIINFYRDEDTLINAYNNGEIEAMNSVSPTNIKKINNLNNDNVKTSTLPRVYGVFFNENQSNVLTNKEVRRAFNLVIDRQKIVDEVLNGYGQPIYGPIPDGLIEGSSIEKESENRLEDATKILTNAGWVKSSSTGIMQKKISKKETIELSITISTLNSQDLVKTAELIKSDWEKLGAKVEIKQFEYGDLQQNIIRTRKYEALLYGTVTGRDLDFFAFWHSSQRNDPGLNISMYANSKVDKLLEDARKTLDMSVRTEKYLSFQKEITNDVPAIFLYSPKFIYIIPDKIKNISTNTITLPYERFLNINSWYIETNNLWKIFYKK